MEQIIQKYNDWLSCQNYDSMSFGLFDGQMGLCIYWYQQGRIYNNRSYEQLADKLLDNVIINARKCPYLDIENGSLGIGLGILYLLENKYVLGVTNNVLFELDEKVFQQLYFGYIVKTRKSLRELQIQTWGMLYLCWRLRTGILEQTDGFLYRNLLVKGLNSLETSLRDMSLKEPSCFSLSNYYAPILIRLIIEMYKLDINTSKLDMLCRGLIEKIYSSTPFNMGNRIVLCSEIDSLISCLKKQNMKLEFSIYRNMLLQGVDVSVFFKNGLMDKQLFVENGVAGILFYQCIINNSANLHIDENCLIKKILGSTLWNNWECNFSDKSFPMMGYSMYHGIPGVIFSFQRFQLF